MIFVPIGRMPFHRESAAPSIRPFRLAVSVFFALALLAGALPARAVTLIRDPDIEHALSRLAEPVLIASGLGPNIRVLLVDDRSLNAFVLDNQHIFLNLGMLLKLDTPEALQAVIAHEAAHITNGHVARRITNMGYAQSAANLGMALALAVAAATGETRAAAGLALGTASSAERRFLAHTRAEESAADQSGVRYLAQGGIDPQGAVQLHRLFHGQELLNPSRQDPYMRSHPLSRDRMRAMQSFVDTHPVSADPNPEAHYWFARARGKAAAFSHSAKWTLQRAPLAPSGDIRAMMEATAYLRQADWARARSRIAQALSLRSEDAFYHELHGQILLESRDYPAAVAAYGRAVALAPQNALCLAGYGRALLAAKRDTEALTVLEKARARDFRNPHLLRDLGQAYARTGQPGLAALATAERYALQGRLKDAEIHAKRASHLLARGSSAWRRAEDILLAAKRAEHR